MKVGHDEKTKGDGDDAEELDVVVRADAVSEVFCDLTIENNTSTAGGEDEETDDESAKIE